MHIVEIGKFQKVDEKILFPLGQGMVLQYNELTREIVNFQLENSVIQLFNEFGTEQVNLTIVNLDVRFSFPVFIPCFKRPA